MVEFANQFQALDEERRSKRPAGRARLGAGILAEELEHLDSGETCESAFETDGEYGFRLSVKRLGRHCFRISFGHQCPPEFQAGDLGVWDVQFNDDRTVATIVQGLAMIF
jgi:hypothetical protein